LAALIVKYLLDTHAAIWLLEGSPKLGVRAKQALAAETEDSVAISDISLLEIAMLESRSVIKLAPDATRGVEAFARHLMVLPIEARVAVDAVAVALPHRDPFDRVIVATARVHGLILVTKDEKIVNANVVSTMW
jgi:PIN domain nuclease of toxin-antitoxin system